MSRKTFIFPVHALSYEKLQEKTADGTMPTLARLKEEGTWGGCQSVFSTASAVDYASLMTGCAPETHGITDFQTNRFDGDLFAAQTGQTVSFKPPKALGETRLFTHDDLQVPWLWDLMTEHRVIQFGLFTPATYPAPVLPNNGVWVSGYHSNPTHYLRDSPEACNSDEVRETLVDSYEDYFLTPLFAMPPVYPDVDSEKDYLEQVLKTTIALSEQLHAARREVIKEQEFDILVSEEPYCDTMQHLLWPRSSDNPLHSEVDTWLDSEGLLDRFYRHIDDLLASYLDLLPSDTNVIIVSAHGQHEAEKEEWMHDTFKHLYEHDIWKPPEGWRFREEKPVWSPPARGVHSMRGVYLCSGPDFQHGGEHAASCMDIAPTVLDLYGYRKPAHMDGQTINTVQ